MKVTWVSSQEWDRETDFLTTCITQNPSCLPSSRKSLPPCNLHGLSAPAPANSISHGVEGQRQLPEPFLVFLL